MRRIVLAGSVMLAVAVSCFGQTSGAPKASQALDTAASRQRDVLARLAGILQEEKVLLSDGAVQAALEGLLNDEIKQADRIRDLGKQTLGKRPEELTDAQRAERDQLADNQNVYADRYRRLEKGIEAKAGARPDSVFVKLLMVAEEAELREKLTDAADLIRDNQLGRAMRTTNEIVAALREMANAVSQGTEAAIENKNQAGDGVGFTAPSLRHKSPWEKLQQFGWTGAEVETIAVILRAVRRLEELAERQRQVSEKTADRAAKGDKTADDLAREEWEIRYLALEAGAQLALIEPEIDGLVRKACETIVSATPGMEKGPLSDAVEPSRRAVDELQAAADRAKQTWKEILARLKQYTMEAEQIMGMGMGIPHGASKKMIEQMQEMVFKMIRATGALTKAIERQGALLDQTTGAATGTELPALKPEQDALGKYLIEEVVPFNVRYSELPHFVTGAIPGNYDVTFEMLADAMDRMARSSEALTAGDGQEAARREEQAIELMTDTLKMMIKLLQHLLGQYASQAMTPQSGGGSTTFVLDPSAGAGKTGGYLFGLPSEKREIVRQHFSGTFPQRYERAIKQYYQVIARTSDE